MGNDHICPILYGLSQCFLCQIQSQKHMADLIVSSPARSPTLSQSSAASDGTSSPARRSVHMPSYSSKAAITACFSSSISPARFSALGAFFNLSRISLRMRSSLSRYSRRTGCFFPEAFLQTTHLKYKEYLLKYASFLHELPSS